jgi:hypothetical protein
MTIKEICDKLDNTCHFAAIKLKSHLMGRSFKAYVTFCNTFEDISGEKPSWRISMPDVDGREIFVKKNNYNELTEKFHILVSECKYHYTFRLRLEVVRNSVEECLEEFEQRIESLPENDTCYPDFDCYTPIISWDQNGNIIKD